MKKVIKFIGYTVLGIIGIFVLAVIVGINMSDPETDGTVTEEVAINEVDEAEKAEEARIADSIFSARRSAAINDLKNFRSNTDEFEGLSFYRDKRTPVYANRNFVYPYIGQKDSTYYLRLKFQYTSDDWLFIRGVKIKTDSNDYEIAAEFERDNDSDIWEWYDMPANGAEIRMLRDIALSKDVKIRYVGNQYHDDRTMSSREKDIIKKTLDIYQDL